MNAQTAINKDIKENIERLSLNIAKTTSLVKEMRLITAKMSRNLNSRTEYLNIDTLFNAIEEEHKKNVN